MPRNDKPPCGGLTDRTGRSILHSGLECKAMVGDRYTTVKHPNASATLDGETTRRAGLNLDRGSGPLDTQRIAGKREPHLSNQGKVASIGMAPSGLSRESHASRARRSCLYRSGFTIRFDLYSYVLTSVFFFIL